MATPGAAPTTLLDLFGAVPADRIAVIAPEQNLRVSYGALRSQVESLVSALAAAGIGRGDRVALALPNGLPAIVSFLAASLAGTGPLSRAPGHTQSMAASYTAVIHRRPRRLRSSRNPTNMGCANSCC